LTTTINEGLKSVYENKSEDFKKAFLEEDVRYYL
jgi:hypothetical protein